jgi:cytochrome c
MKAMVAYINWWSKDMPKDVFGMATPIFEGPNRTADVKKGKEVDNRFCISFHGKNGDCYQSISAGDSGSHVAPAVWGAINYNS